ncbi:alpha-L-fucosidase [Aquimarina sp. AD10]|uniref:alpha-L-fucosidase n=1 Tax=Aquimarina TaxID=290174 RepID=UPI000E4CDF57|nr:MULTISPECIES: alpha-L-fucosidase [Aquimarina]AXT60538.1 alpha-L-fucosidase [Aquimarina sp. AD10]RKN01629.1 alpha-L-fucosidase [Aquimarina sp. AD10]
MTCKKQLFLLVCIMVILAACGPEKNKDKAQESRIKTSVDTIPAKYEPNWESIKSKYKDPEWFNDQKFGIFIHWGAYSVPAYGSEWYPRQMYMDSANFSASLEHYSKGATKEFKHHKEKWGDHKKFGYKDFIPMFKGEKFDAKEWISLFKKAGAKYVIPVADHHDGFAMYKSNTTRWNAADMGPKRDVLGELFKEGRDNGMIMGTSSHFAFNWSFFNKKDHFDTVDPEYADLYSSKGKDLNEPVSEKFKERWWLRIKDIIDNYQPEILWLDFYVDIPDFKEYRPKLAAYYYNKGLEWNKEVVLQDKNFSHEAFPEGTVIYDLERGKLPGIRKLPWQTDTSIGKNSWSHVTNWESKTANQLIDDLVDIVSKNGNLLLNVGPKSDGTIPQDQKDILLEIGTWLETNGDAIYNTKYWKTFGEGPTGVEKGHHSEKNNKEFTGQDIRFTHKDNKLYAILMAWPENNVVNIKSLSKNAEHAKSITIKDIKLLGSEDAKLVWSQDDTALKVNLPGKKVGNHAHVLEINL